MGALDTLFVAVNVEDNSTDEAKEDNKENDDRALTRFEFLEALVRIAFLKFFDTGITDDPSAAVNLLCERNIVPNLDLDRLQEGKPDFTPVERKQKQGHLKQC